MIISHEHRFIFIRTKKTASTSMAMTLSGVCGSRDVISPLTKGEEEQKEIMGLTGAQNFHVPLSLWTARDMAKFLVMGRRPRYAKHMSVRSLRTRVDRTTWSTYFKFCVERNPFDRVVSLYYWRTRKDSQKSSLVAFLRSLDEESLSNFHIYSLDGKVAVDKVIRYEQLAEGLRGVTDQLGLGMMELPRMKTEYRKNQVHYRDLMTPEARAIVQRACCREIELFDYEY